jgi:anti-sigma factor (TIGR02949 family)
MDGCEETRRYVDARLDGELDPGAAMLVDTHLARCPACRSEADSIRAIKAVLASSREGHAAPPALRSRLLAALDEEDQGRTAAEQSSRRRKHAAQFVMAGAALTTLAIATGWRGAVRNTGPIAGAAMMPPLLEDIAQRHARNLPSEVSGAQPEQVANFFTGRLDIPVRPVRFHGVPARLVGARISHVWDRMAAALYYDVGGRRVTVFVFDSTVLPRAFDSESLQPIRVNDHPAYVGNARGYTVVLSERGGVAYAVTSDLPASDTLGIVSHADLQ